MPHPLNLMGGGGGTLLIHRQTRTLLPGHPGDVVLEVEQVLHIPDKRSHLDVEVRALEVRHGLKALLPYGVLLILNQEKRDRQCCCSDEAVLAQGGESDVRYHLNASVRLAVDDRPRSQLRGVEGYHHANLALVQSVGHGQPATVDRSIPVVAKTDECII
jgi:hypothetical protein